MIFSYSDCIISTQYGCPILAGHYNTGFFPFTVQGGGTGVVYENQWSGWNSTWAKLNLQEERVTSGSNLPLGICDGSNVVDGNIEATGWPCFAQVGRGPGNIFEPVYAWKNGTQAGCADGGECSDSIYLTPRDGVEDYIKSTPHSNGEVDFVNNGTTPKSGYVPYVYPHPLQGGSQSDLTPPSAPGGLSVR